MDIKIVGQITDEDELDEIQNVAKIFVIERRMKHFKYLIKNENPIRRNLTKIDEKIKHHPKIIHRYKLPYVMVRGLC
jgi:hypothetical protein